ncbi:MAG: AAA family ATPase [Candidatus Sericytochromatia bacterium]|nr:AAA family ATPase [Candidatus Sericytochromatia bacterium]
MFEKLSSKSIKVVMFAQEEARRYESTFVENEHLLLGILKENTSVASKLLNERGIDYDSTSLKLEDSMSTKKSSLRFEMQFSPLTKQAIELAMDEAEKLKDDLVEPEHLLLGIVNIGEGIAISIMKDAGINLSRMRWHILRLRESNENDDEGSAPATISLTTDLTAKVEQKEINAVIGRNYLIEEVIPHLNLFNKIYPLIIGESGVGKTSLIIGITQYLMEGKIYKELQNFRVLEFDFNTLLSEAVNPEDINKLFKTFANEVKQAKDIILVVDNLENIFQEKLINSGIISIFLQILKSGNTYLIGITNPESYQNVIKKSELKKYFKLIDVPEADRVETKMFLEHWQNKISEFYNVDIDDEALNTIVDLTKNYYPEKYYPASALELLDLAVSKKKFSRSIAQSRIKDMERHLKVLRHQRDVYLEQKNFHQLEEIKHEAQVYEEEIKILTVNMLSSIRPTLTSGDIQLIVGKKLKEEDKS